MGQANYTPAGTDASVRETGNLIGSDKVEGTSVYGPDDRKIGSIERIMIDKRRGQVAYAVMSFGGFLGIGEDYYPLPWAKLTYDPLVDGYRVDITEDQLRGAPHFGRDESYSFGDIDQDRRITDFYGVPPYVM